MKSDYDLVVIGAGAAGGAIASQAKSAGMSVALMESRDYGGTCPLRGCNPKKVLVGAAEILARKNDMRGKGISGGCQIDWPELMRFKRKFTEGAPENIEKAYAEKGIETFHGRASFIDKNIVLFEGKEVHTRRIAICAGAAPRPLDIEGEESVATSDDFLELEKLPSSIIFVGGGYISFEFAHIAARAGSEVTIVHRSAQVLKGFDPDLVDMLVEATKELGVRVITNAPARAVEKREGRYILRTGRTEQTRDLALEADLIVHGAGRAPDIRGLALEKAGVEASDKGIRVNEYMQSVSNDAVYAAGDVAATPFALTPTASLEAEAAGHNIIHGPEKKVDRTGIPSAVFTTPPLASVGAGEERLRKDGVDYVKKFRDTSSEFTSQRIGLNHSGIKVLLERKSLKILGAHILGHHAEEMINIFALAMRHNLTGEDLKHTIWTYPSSVYDVKHLFD